MYDARNVGSIERLLSAATGALLGVYAVQRRGVPGILAGIASGMLLNRGITGWCPVYSAIGVDTAGLDEATNPNASVPYGRGVRVEESITVARPAAELYAFWRELNTLPRFMEHLEEVTTLTPTRSRWRVRAPIGSRATWEAEIINDVPGQIIGWRSLPGSAIHHAGSVHFDSRDGMTEVRVVLEYAPPARYVGASIARILGEDPQRQVGADLRRFKEIVERGEHASL